MAYNFRHRSQRVRYEETRDGESDSNSSDLEYSTLIETPRGNGRGRGRGRGRRINRQREREHSLKRRQDNVTRWANRGGRSHRIARRNIVLDSEESNERNNNLEMETAPSSINQEPLPTTTSGISSSQKARRTKKTILSWLTDCRKVEDGDLVNYLTERSGPVTGRINNGAIMCNCCDKEVSVWNFERHNKSDRKQPYKHIQVYRDPELCSLQESLIGAWQKDEEQKRRAMFTYVPKNINVEEPVCLICGNGGEGEYICCHNCPSVYHTSCVNMEGVPYKNWLCHYCICKYCGVGGVSQHLSTCCQCNKKFHWACLQLQDRNCPSLYCGPSCKEIYEKLEGLLGIQNDIDERYSWRVVHKVDTIPGVVPVDENLRMEINAKVAVTWMLMNEVFETIIDQQTGINVVQSVVYSCGSNLRRVNFSRFYTFVIEKDDEMIGAASIRFHGKEIVEMPFIATDEAYRGKGICRLLMGIIESFMCDLKVKNLIIPSNVETTEMWKVKYNFDVVNNKVLKKNISSYNMLMFPRAIRLYKDFFNRKLVDMNAEPDQEI
uniref:Increased DNA methylation 1-like n=1 Tax=Cicer arietinum TaxID=3827 RepID=A0A3Q7Y431_CICAR|nr:increased DNA methylation 1-like [Cicer arietinum]